MATRKKLESGPTTSELAEHLARQDTVLEKLDKKLEDAHVLNGGFDSLMEKVSKIDSIELGLKEVKTCVDTQGKTLDEVHKAIYDKDEGLYQKVKGVIKWISTANWVIKGVAVTAATGAAGGLCKLAYDIISGHLLIHYAH
jgi:hypothetical protein